MDLTKQCRAPAIGGICVLPSGHNIGRVDIPENHSAEGRAAYDHGYLDALREIRRNLGADHRGPYADELLEAILDRGY